MHSRPRNYRAYSLPAHTMMTLLHEWRQAQFIRLPVLTHLPADCEVCDVTWNFLAKCFDVILWHPSFPEVPDGLMIPDAGVLTFETVEFARPDPDEPVLVDRR